MQTVTTDLFATKGVEYLLVIGYLVLLVACWWLIFPRKRRDQPATAAHTDAPRRSFKVPTGFYYHQGHTWAQPETDGIVRVGIDDFAQQVLGLSFGALLPALGTHLTQGELGWHVELADGNSIPLLAPVDGEVVGVNPEVLLHPALMNSDPYGRGWLMRVHVKHPASVSRNLLSGALARAWIAQVTESLPRVDGAELGIVLPGGTFGATGIARALSPHGWQAVARGLLRIDEAPLYEGVVVADQKPVTV